MSNEMLIRCCAPTMASLKTGNMFNCPFDSREEMTAELRRLDVKGCVCFPCAGTMDARWCICIGRKCWKRISGTIWLQSFFPNAGIPVEIPTAALLS